MKNLFFSRPVRTFFFNFHLSPFSPFFHTVATYDTIVIRVILPYPHKAISYSHANSTHTQHILPVCCSKYKLYMLCYVILFCVRVCFVVLCNMLLCIVMSCCCVMFLYYMLLFVVLLCVVLYSLLLFQNV